MSEKRDLKGPDQMPAKADRAKQTEEPSRQYLDLLSGRICVDGYEPTSKAETEDPNAKIITKRLSNTSAKPSGVGTN